MFTSPTALRVVPESGLALSFRHAGRLVTEVLTSGEDGLIAVGHATHLQEQER